MKRKLFASLLLFILCFLIVGCGNKDKEEDNESTDSETSTNQEIDDVKLYSDGTKYVFEYTNTKYVFYYSGDTVTAYHTYVDYGDAATAKYAYAALRIEDYDTVEKYYQKGKYIIFEWKKSEYEDLKASDIKTAYSYMKEIKEQ